LGDILLYGWVRFLGHTSVRVKVINPLNSKEMDVDLLVDAGSTYTWVRCRKLKSLGLKPTGRRRFRTINGKIVEREVGEAKIEYEDEKATCMIVFGKEEDVEVLGVIALENLGLEVDPITKN